MSAFGSSTSPVPVRLYPQGFRYCDWLIRAFNTDMPYDRFIRSLADLGPSEMTVRATTKVHLSGL